MTKHIAFLRAINVGGHTVKMDVLRQLFESLGFSNVETFIASGNVLFETNSKNADDLETKIESRLRETLGYDVATFVRTDADLKAVAVYKPFPQSQLDAATAFNVAFLKESLDNKTKQKVMALRSAIDDFHIHESELYWLCKKKQSDSKFSNAVLEKTIGKPSTIRGMATIQKIAAKY
ncbi:MAG TPA: DUF1697 domain-containing protein [Anaerolineales bacterium]